MLKLFAVLLGGRATGCNTELHDIVFAVGDSLEETYPKLIKKWFGVPKQLHIDSSMELKYVDGYEVSVNRIKPENQTKKLFFINFGAYKENQFGEIHQQAVYVAQTKTEALIRAKKDLCLSLIEPHCDDNLCVDDIFVLENIDQYYIHLKPTILSSNLTIESYYRRLDLPEIIAEANSL